MSLECGISPRINELVDRLRMSHHELHMRTRIYVATPQERRKLFENMKFDMGELETELIKQGEI